jgi:hypothetical protein
VGARLDADNIASIGIQLSYPICQVFGAERQIDMLLLLPSFEGGSVSLVMNDQVIFGDPFHHLPPPAIFRA